MLEFHQFYRAKKHPKGDTQDSKTSFTNWKQQKIHFFGFFSFGKSLIESKSPKRDLLNSLTILSSHKNFVKSEGVPFYRKRTVSKKSRQCRKKPYVFCTIIEKTLISPTGLKKINHRLPLKLGKRFCTTEKRKKNKNIHFCAIFSRKMLPVSRIVPKTLRSPLCSQNVVSSKNQEGLRRKQIGK